LRALKVLLEKVVLPKKARLSQIDKAHESEPEFKRLRRQHSPFRGNDFDDPHLRLYIEAKEARRVNG